MYGVCDIIIQLLEDSPPQTWDGIRFDEILLDMRGQRMGLIQAPDQLRFTFKTILTAKKLIVDKSWPSIFLDPEFDADETPPPPPPPPLRSESLEADNGEPPQRSESPEASNRNSELRLQREGLEANNKKSEMRQRRQETSQKIQEIKRKMKETEDQPQFWSSYLPHMIGIGALVLGTCAFVVYKHSSNQL